MTRGNDSNLSRGFKRTEIGPVPIDWAIKPLGEVLSRARLGGNYPNQDAEAELPLMKMGNIGRGHFDLSKTEYIVPGTQPDLTHRLAAGDVLFNTRNTLDLVGKVALWRDELPVAYFNSNLMRLEFDSAQISSNEYGNLFLNTGGSVSRLRAMATGTTSVAAIYTRDLLTLPIAVPSPCEQQAIAEVLRDVDALLAGLDRLIAKKRDLKQAAMQQLLTGRSRLPGFHDEWEMRRLSEIAEVSSGGTPSRANPEYWNGTIPWVTTSEVDFRTVEQTTQYISHEGLKNSAAKLLPPGTLLMALYGQGKTRGKVAILGIEGATNQACAAISLSPEACREYVFYCLVNQYEEIRSLSNIGNQENLSGALVRSIEVPLPCISEQRAIACVLSDLDAEHAALEARRDKTRALKQAMMQELLTGRIRLI